MRLVLRRGRPGTVRIAVWERTGVRPAVAVWTPEQTGRFLDTAIGHRYYALFHLIAFRGLRRGEAVGIRWEDVDLDARTLTVTQQVVQLGWETEVGAPKTDSGSRIVTLDDASTAALRSWREVQDAEARLWGEAWTNTGLVFTLEDGTGVHPARITDAFQVLTAQAGLSPIRLHDLRHTAASLALQAGVPLKVVSEQLGRSSLAITADIYTSVLPAVAHAPPRPSPASSRGHRGTTSRRTRRRPPQRGYQSVITRAPRRPR